MGSIDGIRLETFDALRWQAKIDSYMRSIALISSLGVTFYFVVLFRNILSA